MKKRRMGAATQLERTITVRVANEDVKRLEKLGEELGVKAMTIARLFIRQGLERAEAEGPTSVFSSSVTEPKRPKANWSACRGIRSRRAYSSWPAGRFA